MATKVIGPDNFEMINLASFKGYASTYDPTNSPKDVLIRGSQNVYKSSNGTIVSRCGRKLYDVTVDSTLAGVKSAFVWNTSIGKTYPIRIANAKLQVYSNVTGSYVWYDLLTAMSTTRGVFDPIWDGLDKKDKLVFVIGDNNIYDWSGGITLILSGTNGTITKQGTLTWAQAGFASTGTVTVSGVDYTYSGGSTTTTLTGVGTDASSFTSGLVAIQKIVTTAKKDSGGSSETRYVCDFIKSIAGQLWVGSYTSNLVYVSKQSPIVSGAITDYTNFTVPATPVAGDPDLIIMDNAGKGIGVRGSSLTGNAHIFAGTSDLYIVSYEQVSNGSSVVRKTNVDKRSLGILESALAHEFIDSSGDTLVWLSQDQQLRYYSTVRNLTQPAAPLISDEVSTDLANEDFTGGAIKIIAGEDKGELIYIIAPNSGVVYVHQTRTGLNALGNLTLDRSWFTPFVWGLSRIDVIGSDVIGFSNSNPQMYYLWDTLQWHDDGASNSAAIQLAYTSIMVLPYNSYGRRQGKIRFDKVYWEGYMTQGTSLYGVIYYDYQGATSVLAPIIHSIADNSPANNSSFFTGVVPPSLGDASLGENPLGDATAVIQGNVSIRDHDLMPKFRIITGVSITDCFEFSLMCFTSKADDRFEIIALGANVSEAPFSGIEIQK